MMPTWVIFCAGLGSGLLGAAVSLLADRWQDRLRGDEDGDA